MRSTLRSLAFAAGTFAALATPGVAPAQQLLTPVRVTAEQAARADALHAEAKLYDGSLRAFRKVARLHEQAAALREPDDSRNFECLRTAALLRYYSGDRRGGGVRMEEAAVHASAHGDVVAAANAYIDAAIIANETRQSQRVRDLARRAVLLTSSPLLTEAQRLDLRGRISGSFAVAMLDRP